MKIIRSYTNVWDVERMIYGVRDFHLPRPVRMSSFVVFVALLLLSLKFKGFPPFIFTDSVLMNHIGVPFLITWLLGRMDFDGKKLPGIFRSLTLWLIRPRAVVRGKPVRMRNLYYKDVWVTIAKEGKGEDG